MADEIEAKIKAIANSLIAPAPTEADLKEAQESEVAPDAAV
jgi:hypothetical protein